MVMEQHEVFSGSKLFRQAAGAACLVLFLTILPARSFAQCEPNGDAMSTAVAIAGKEHSDVATMVNILEESWTDDLDALRARLGIQDQTDWNCLIGGKAGGCGKGGGVGLNTFWQRWQSALKDSTAQLSAGTQDQSRQLGSINDASNELAAAEDEQQERLKSKLQYQPTDQACRFDTAAEYLAETELSRDALAQGFEWDFVSNANNEIGSMGQYGPGDLERNRWNLYVSTFCDYQAEDCNSGCSKVAAGGACTFAGTGPTAYMDQDVLPTNMLFGKYTINLFNPTEVNAMDSMLFNVTGYLVPEPIVSGALGTVAGIDQMFARREYMAQMSAAGSLLYAVVADRAPGPRLSSGVAAPGAQEIRTMRGMMGAPNPSGDPSVREVRQSIIEQLWDPNFYKNLGDNPSTMAQKELYLKAYGLVMLYDMISKQEKISTAYAIETAALLETLQHSRAGFTSQAPVQ